MTTLPLGEVLDEARAIAGDAAAILMNGWRSGVRVEKKGAIDLLTEYDLRSETLVRERLAAAFPQHRVVAEEGADDSDGEITWYVDPLDGTTNFAHGHFFFCVSMGLVVAGEPVLGVVHAPALSTVWSGARGLGAFRNGEKIRVSSTRALDDSLCATGFPYDRRTHPQNNLREFGLVKMRSRGVRRCGAAAIDLALVADGTYDAYWEFKLKPWDLAAGALLVREAGGRLSASDGGAADVRTGALVATNGLVHDELLAVLRS